jgi:hypothetical protein
MHDRSNTDRRHLAMASDNNWHDEHEDGLELDGDNTRLL